MPNRREAEKAKNAEAQHKPEDAKRNDAEKKLLQDEITEEGDHGRFRGQEEGGEESAARPRAVTPKHHQLANLTIRTNIQPPFQTQKD